VLQEGQEVLASILAATNASDKDAIRAMYESKIASLESSNEITNKIGNESQAILSAVNNGIVSNDKNTTTILSAISADGSATRALINANEVQNLRDELESERRRGDRRETEININNSNSQTQAQVQTLTNSLVPILSGIQSQFAHNTNSLVNLGTMLGTAQTASNANTSVN